MVIQKFNKLIRNKWVWGAFAIAISLFFAFDFLIDDLGRDTNETASVDGAGTLGGETVKASYFQAVVNDVRDFDVGRDTEKSDAEINRMAWEVLATLAVADKNGITVTDDEIREAIRRDPAFAVNGQFNYDLYARRLRDNNMTEMRFEEFLRRRLTIARVAELMVASSSWVSPMEINQAVADMTDSNTVRVASFTQTKAEMDAVKLDEAGLRKWFSENTNSLALPERVKIRMVAFDATDTNVLARMTVTENELRDHYDATIDQYTSTDTNGVETVKTFEEVKDRVERELRQIVAVQCFTTNLSQRAYMGNPQPGVSRLDTIAKEDARTVVTTDWFPVSGGFVKGFMKSASSICPGANGFLEAVAAIDPANAEERYAVVSSDTTVWLIEKAETSPAHVPTFEEAQSVKASKDEIESRALKAARADAFKASVEAIRAQGTNAVCATANVSTNISFVISDLQGQQLFPNQGAVASAARRLSAGEISEFVRTGYDTAILVVCVDRQPGDPALAALISSQAREGVSQLQRGTLPEAWQSWNLERMGVVTADFSAMDAGASSADGAADTAE